MTSLNGGDRSFPVCREPLDASGKKLAKHLNEDHHSSLLFDFLGKRIIPLRPTYDACWFGISEQT